MQPPESGTMSFYFGSKGLGFRCDKLWLLNLLFLDLLSGFELFLGVVRPVLSICFRHLVNERSGRRFELKGKANKNRKCTSLTGMLSQGRQAEGDGMKKSGESWRAGRSERYVSVGELRSTRTNENTTI